MKPNIITTIIAGLALAWPCLAETETAKLAPVGPEERVVQLAILLDTSGSMEGLISQAKSQLWKIVNEFIAAKQDGKTAVVQVALYEYGKDSLSEESHWIRQIQPLTRDLDKVSEELFKLTTNGGDEYCGAVIDRAVKDLAWDPAPSTYKAIFIAGNEPFTQGPIKAKVACQSAIKKGVIVNTIHCGDKAVGVEEGWKSGALLADGSYLVIDQNQAVVHIPSPFDADLERLSGELNKTYIAFGTLGSAKAESQTQQDGNALAEKRAGASVQRALTKASANYSNSIWDLVDACKQKDFQLEKVKDEELPKEMRQMKPEERKAFVEAKAAERAKIQAEIAELGKKRSEFVAAKEKEAGAANTLDKAVSKAVRSQAAKKNILFASETAK